MTGLLILLATGLALCWASAVVYVAWMLTHPPRRTYASAVARGRPGEPSELVPARRFESWTFKSRRLEFPVWEIEGDDAAGPAVILTHGWADSRIGGLVRVPAIAGAASRVILWDLRGHGEAPGVCRLGTAEVEDLEALVELVKGQRGRGAEGRSDGASRHQGVGASSRDAETAASVVLYGWSLGAGVSIVVAARQGRDGRIAGVIAESPYRVPATPARNVLRARGLPHRGVLEPALWMVGVLLGVGPRFKRTARGPSGTETFDRAAHAARLVCPLLVIHGTEDEVCPIEDGRAIAAAAPAGLRRIAEIESARHNDLWTEPANAERCRAAIQQFLSEMRAV